MFCDFKNRYLILKDYNYWTLSLADSQFLIGWSHAFLKRHVRFFEELTDEELFELKQVIKELKKALKKTFNPDWFNVMQLGNMTPHLHFQLVPRYKDKRTFDGRTFTDNTWGKMIPNRWETESEEFLTRLAGYIKENL